MATKCIDQMPPPIATAAAASQACRVHPLPARARLARSRAVYEAKAARTMDSATRAKSCVPATVMGHTSTGSRCIDGAPTLLFLLIRLPSHSLQIPAVGTASSAKNSASQSHVGSDEPLRLSP